MPGRPSQARKREQAQRDGVSITLSPPAGCSFVVIFGKLYFEIERGKEAVAKDWLNRLQESVNKL